jgi:hypothetical protein
MKPEFGIACAGISEEAGTIKSCKKFTGGGPIKRYAPPECFGVLTSRLNELKKAEIHIRILGNRQDDGAAFLEGGPQGLAGCCGMANGQRRRQGRGHCVCGSDLFHHNILKRLHLSRVWSFAGTDRHPHDVTNAKQRPPQECAAKKVRSTRRATNRKDFILEAGQWQALMTLVMRARLNLPLYSRLSIESIG